MIKFIKQLINVKIISIFIVIQILITFLYLNTVSHYFDNIKHTQETKDLNVDLQQVVFLSSLSEEQYSIIYNELSENARLYHYKFVSSEGVVFDTNLALLFEKLGYIDVNDTTKSKLTSKKTNETYGVCDEFVFRNEIYSCEDNMSSVNPNLYSELFRSEYLEYNDIFTSHTLIEYDGNLAEFIEKVAINNEFEVNIEIYDNERINSYDSLNIIDNMRMQKQNIIAVAISSSLVILLAVVYYMVIKVRSISILLLLGYSKTKIISTILGIYIMSLIIPFIMLSSNGSLVTMEYIVISTIIGALIIITTFYVFRNLMNEKARERQW